MTRRMFPLALAAAILACAGCNSYDPHLNNKPFRCGTSEPRCPDGYTCVKQASGEEVCERGGGAVADAAAADASSAQPDAAATDASSSDAGSAAFACNNDHEVEPNESPAQAFPLPIPGQSDYALVGLAICPGDDVDVFEFAVDQEGEDARADITYDSARATLTLEMLNSSGVTIRQGAPLAGDPDHLRVEVPNLPNDRYYVRVASKDGAQNNYDFHITMTGP